MDIGEESFVIIITVMTFANKCAMNVLQIDKLIKKLREMAAEDYVKNDSNCFLRCEV
jgi:hypothetical protein